MPRDQAARLRDRVRPSRVSLVWALGNLSPERTGQGFAQDISRALQGSPWDVTLWEGGDVHRGRILLLMAGDSLPTIRRTFLRGTDTWILLADGTKGGLEATFALVREMREVGKKDVWLALSDVSDPEFGDATIGRLSELALRISPSRISPFGYYCQGAPGDLVLSATARRRFFAEESP